MKYAIEMGSDVMIYLPRFVKIGSAIQKLTAGGYTDIQKHRQHGDLISLHLDFQTKECNIFKTFFKHAL
jgi:hypothetical protein